MIQKLSAIYENGLLRPLHNPNLPEKSEFNLVIESDLSSEHHLLQFAGILSDGEAQYLENIINQEFRTVNHDQWENRLRYISGDSLFKRPSRNC